MGQDGYLMITTILIDYLINILSTDDLGLKITSDNKSLSDQSKTADDHQMIA